MVRGAEIEEPSQCASQLRRERKQQTNDRHGERCITDNLQQRIFRAEIAVPHTHGADSEIERLDSATIAPIIKTADNPDQRQRY